MHTHATSRSRHVPSSILMARSGSPSCTAWAEALHGYDWHEVSVRARTSSEAIKLAVCGHLLFGNASEVMRGSAPCSASSCTPPVLQQLQSLQAF